MSNEDNHSYEDTLELSFEIAIPYPVRFWIILLFYIPSLICSLFILYNFIVCRTLRQALCNHVIILLLFINLIVQLTGIPWILNYYHLGYVWPQNPSFCLTWIFIDEALYITTTLLFAWATIERHILIFHDQLVSTKYKIIFFHYLPTIIIILYCICYNVSVIIVPTCENRYDYTQIVCGYPLCYYEIHLVATWDIVANDIVPTIIIIFCSIALLLRVFYQKYQMRRPILWRRHRKMTIQLLSISLLYLVLYIPRMLMEFIYLCGVSEDFGANFMAYAEFFAYYGNFFLPFVCAGSMPELKSSVKKIFQCWRQQTRAVGPQTLSGRAVRPQTLALSRRTFDPQLRTTIHVP
ncbi:unnamed protein product [Rotaria sordida]|uniref:G-protein coupled receptors family 1 profile domain-containing protein n=1 Tax=Rotaria sordida TaxID=392033 RepID=A0A819ZDN0_9BILA|nr:unnamed protein product [Rotaria sordida]CAF4172618.1 unnamed protein product [Rotaria sordida]